jgi:hypothetical protein
VRGRGADGATEEIGEERRAHAAVEQKDGRSGCADAEVDWSSDGQKDEDQDVVRGGGVGDVVYTLVRNSIPEGLQLTVSKETRKSAIKNAGEA